MDDISPIALRVLEVACKVSTDTKGASRVNPQYLADATDVDVGTVQNAVTALRALGLIELLSKDVSVSPTAQGRALFDPNIKKNADNISRFLLEKGSPSSGKSITQALNIPVRQVNWAVELLFKSNDLLKVTPGTQGSYTFDQIAAKRGSGIPMPEEQSADDDLRSVGSQSNRSTLSLRPASVTGTIAANAEARAEAQEKIQEAIEVLRAEEWRAGSLEKELIEGFVIGELQTISDTLDLQTDNIDDIRAALARIEQARSLLDKAIDIFRNNGREILVNVLASALFTLGAALIHVH